MHYSCRSVLFILPLVATSILAGPKISFDTKTFDCGNVLEDKIEKLNAVFNVTNVGDAPLKLENVRPGCGCTVVKYDSLILPGKSAKIESAVNIKGYKSGHISKYVTVTSNAENEGTVRLTIEATIQAIIDVSGNYIGLTPANEKSPVALYLSSQKNDLKVSDVSFKSGETSGTPAWQADLSYKIKYTWNPTDSVRTDGYKVYKLELFFPTIDKTVSGEFTLTTNHPEKSKVNLQGNISK